MKIAGVDYDSNRIDIVTVDLDTLHPEWTRYPLTGPLLAGDAFDRACRVRYALPPRTFWTDEGVVQFAIENPYAAAFKSAVALARIQGSILACLPREIPILPLAPNEWKRALGLPLGGKRDQTKAEVRAKALELGAPEEWPQDAHDALCIAHAYIALANLAAANPPERSAA